VTAQAGESRSLTTLAASDEPVAAAPATAVETARAAETPKATEAPKYVEPPAIDTRTEQPKAEPSTAEPAKPVAHKTTSVLKTERPRHKRYWNEARIIRELHRHGIYW
jgi:hypothetical protein